MKATATLFSVLVLAACGDERPPAAPAPAVRPALPADLLGAWTATLGYAPSEIAFSSREPSGADLELTLGTQSDGWDVTHLPVDASKGMIDLGDEKRCGMLAASVAGDRLTFAPVDEGCPATYVGELLKAEVWRRRPPVPARLAGTWTATIAGERVSASWTLEFNATGGTRNGPAMVLDGGAYGIDVRPIGAWVTGSNTGGLWLEGRGVRGCREFSWVADGDELTLAATGDRCPHTHLHQVLSRGFWERSQ